MTVPAPVAAVAGRRAVAANASARTNLDGGVKSPGRPSMPEPWPIGVNAVSSTVTGDTSVGVWLT